MFRDPQPGGGMSSVRRCLALAAWTMLPASVSSALPVQTAEQAPPQEGTPAAGAAPEPVQPPDAEALPPETQPEALPRGATPGEHSGDDQSFLEGTASATATSRKAHRWEAQIGMGEKWDTNPDDDGGAAIEGSWVTGISGSLAGNLQTRRGTFGVSASAQAARYSAASRLNGSTYEGHVSGSQAMTARTQVGFDAGASRSYTGDTRALTDSGLVLPQTLVERQSVALSVGQHLSQWTTLALRGRFQHLTFPSNGTLEGGTQLDAGAVYAHRLRTNDSVGLDLNFQQNANETEDTGAVYSAATSWRGQLGRRVAASASLGVASFARQLTHERIVRPVGSAALTQKTRFWSGALEYSRQTGQIFGTSRDGLTDVLGCRLSRTFSRSADLSLAYQHGWARDPSDERYSTQSDNVGASFAVRVRRSLAVAASYSFQHNAAQDPVVDRPLQTRHQAQLSLVHVNQW